MYVEHPELTPLPPNSVLWRYMDFTKFVSLLDRQALFFTRADKLGDPFEGSFSKATADVRPQVYNSMSADNINRMTDVISKTVRQLTRHTLINCWHHSDHESDAMWKLYSREHDGIAVKTSFKSFTESFVCEQQVLIGKVNYIDYEKEVIPEGNFITPYVYKRRSFEYEREVRAVILDFNRLAKTEEGALDLAKEVYDVGEYYSVRIGSLVHEVVVAPYAENWLLELVQSVADRYNMSAPVRRSKLAETPMWK